MIANRSRSVSVVIPNCNGKDLLDRFLAGVDTEIGHDNVIVVDDASTDGSTDMLRCDFPRVTVVARTANGGFSAAANDGIRASGSEFVVLLNNDIEVTRGFLEPLLEAFDDESVFAVSPRIILRRRDNLDEGAKTGFWHHGLFYADQRQGVTELTPILYATGCAAVYRRSMLEELGGFDEAYSPFYWEDADLGYRAWKRGWRTVYQPCSTVYHEHSASISRWPAAYTTAIKVRNSLFFIWRNIEDRKILTLHRIWLPMILAKRAAACDSAFLRGWRAACASGRDAASARARDSACRRFSDRSIFESLGIEC